LGLACGLAAGPRAQQGGKDTPKVDLVSVVGCATRGADDAWMLTNASEAKVTQAARTTEKDLEAARTQRLGKNRYRLIGTAEFGSAEELLRNSVRAQFTTKGSENATGVLQNGRKVMVKGLLIIAPNEKRLNLTSVQPLADSCK
jgi:hypothetical protein